jgi:hypothetical protein
VNRPGGRNEPLAVVGAILATGYAALRAEQARKAREQAQLQASTDCTYKAGFSAAKEPYVVVSPQDTSAAKETR